MNPNGTEKWKFNFGSDKWIGKSSPAISADGTIYIGVNKGDDNGGYIYAINPDGSKHWHKKLAKYHVSSSPSIAKNGTVYIGSSYDIASGYIHAFGPIDSNSPPETPTISGETNGEAGTEYKYTFVVIDPDNNPVSFYIDWDDNSTTDWTREYASGEQVKIEHKWSEKGNYTIRTKAKDVLDEESDWATLKVTMPKSQQTSNKLFLKFLKNYPQAFPIIRTLLGL